MELNHSNEKIYSTLTGWFNTNYNLYSIGFHLRLFRLNPSGSQRKYKKTMKLNFNDVQK